MKLGISLNWGTLEISFDQADKAIKVLTSVIMFT